MYKISARSYYRRTDFEDGSRRKENWMPIAGPARMRTRRHARERRGGCCSKAEQRGKNGKGRGRVADTRGPRHTGGLHAYKGWRRDALIAISRVDSKLATLGVDQTSLDTLALWPTWKRFDSRREPRHVADSSATGELRTNTHTYTHVCLSNFADSFFVFGLDRWEDWFFFFFLRIYSWLSDHAVWRKECRMWSWWKS